MIRNNFGSFFFVKTKFNIGITSDWDLVVGEHGACTFHPIKMFNTRIINTVFKITVCPMFHP